MSLKAAKELLKTDGEYISPLAGKQMEILSLTIKSLASIRKEVSEAYYHLKKFGETLYGDIPNGICRSASYKAAQSEAPANNETDDLYSHIGSNEDYEHSYNGHDHKRSKRSINYLESNKDIINLYLTQSNNTVSYGGTHNHYPLAHSNSKSASTIIPLTRLARSTIQQLYNRI